MFEPDLDENQNEDNAELYAKLLPFILRDFTHKFDLKNILFSIVDPERLLFVNLDNNSEGIRVALLYKELLDNGSDELSKKIKPVINI